MLSPGPILALALGAALVLAAPIAATAQEAAPPTAEAEARSAAPLWAPREWALSAGVFDFGKSELAEAGLEARFEPLRFRLFGRGWGLEPALGAMGNQDGGFYGYLSLRLPLDLGARWRVTPHAGGGIYAAGDGKDLGGPVEFRSGLEVALAVGRRSRLGLGYYHLSNAVLYDSNPGNESLTVVWSWRPHGP